MDHVTFATAFVYILCNYKGGALYVGMTKALRERLWEHKTKADPDCFTAKYDIDKLVYFEAFDLVVDAIAREKQLKNWKRKWKVALFEKQNPDWEELKLDWLDLR